MATKKKLPKDKLKTGPKPKEFSDLERGEVRGLAMANVPITEIADYMEIDEKTLKKYFAKELRRGRLTMLAGAATNMARMALGARAEWDDRGNLVRAEVVPQFGPCCFVLKTQGKDFGWSERFEHTGKNGTALPSRLESLTDVQLAALYERLDKGEVSRQG